MKRDGLLDRITAIAVLPLGVLAYALLVAYGYWEQRREWERAFREFRESL